MMAIETKKQYEEAMSRIEELYRQTDESTPADDPMMQEMDLLGQAIEKLPDSKAVACCGHQAAYA